MERDGAGRDVQTDQVLYNLMRRGVEWDLLPWLRERGVPVMAYSPLEQGRLLAQDDVIAIPKTARAARLAENLAAAAHPLDANDLAELDGLFDPPDRPVPLEMI